jgi:RecA/RadA recombinase
MKLNDILKAANNKYATIAADGLEGSDVKGFISTGSYSFNALLSGSIYGGIPDNKIIALAGEQATGKTYFALNVVREFLDSDPTAMVLYFDTEQAITSEMLDSRGIDRSRVAVLPVATVEEFRHQCVLTVDKYLETDSKSRPRMMIVLDSLGMLSTEKEMNDTAEGKGTRDMTRAQVLKATFRVLTIKLGYARIPLILTNHTYDVVGCLSDDVDVLMEDGSVKNISDVVVGDKVETMGGSSLVTELFSYDVNEVVEVELSDGTSFFATPNHKFMTRDGSWKPISDIGEGEEILAVEEFSKS